MKPSQPSYTSTSAPGGKPPSPARLSAEANAQLALPLTEGERTASRKQLDQLHPGNRFRLMFGQPLLPQEPESETSPSSS
jgi:hypothetical protein